MDKKDLKLTNDALTNIHMMIPLLDEEAKEKISCVMYGCYLQKKVEEDVEKNHLAREK